MSSSAPPTFKGGGQDHLDEITCMLYLERQLDRARALEVSAHTQSCDACRTLLRVIERESRLLTRAMLEEEEPLPARIAQFQERVRRSMQWIWLVVFGLASTAVYGIYAGYIQPWEQRLEEAGFGGTSLLSMLIFQGSFWKGWQSMITFVELLAVLTVGGIAMAILRRRFRRASAVALLLASFSGVLVLQPAATATEVRKGETAEITKDEVIKGNAFLSGPHIEVEGTVDGDVYAAGKDIEIDGHITGDLICAGHTVWVRGQIDGNIRSAGNNLNVIGKVNRNIAFFGDTLRIDSKGVVDGSVMMFGSGLNIEGQLGRDILFMGDRLAVLGKVGGAIDEHGANLVIGSTAAVDGPIKFDGEHEAEVSKSAKLASPVQFTKHVHKREEYGRTSVFWTTVFAIAFMLYGMALFLVLPNFARESIHAAENVGGSLGLGLLVFFGVLVGGFIAMVTLVGLLVGVSVLFVWGLAVCAAQPVAGALLGQWILGRTNDTWAAVGRMILGIVIIRTVTLVPHFGGLIKLLVIFWGLGAISIAIYRRFQPAVPAQAPYVPPNAPVAPIAGATA